MADDLALLGPVLPVIAGLLGLVLGSFLNVCILRWPKDESVVRPPSRCPGCGSGIAWYDNIPVVSWLLLRGKCRKCGERISIQYPLVELATGLLWAWMAWRHGASLEALRGATFGTILLGIAMADARFYIIPDEFSLGGLGILLGLAALGGAEELLLAIRGAGIGAGTVALCGVVGTALFSRDAMGGGDVKLMGFVGAILGGLGVVATLFLGAVVAIALSIPAIFRSGHAEESETAKTVVPTPSSGGVRLVRAVTFGLAGAGVFLAVAAAGWLPVAIRALGSGLALGGFSLLLLGAISAIRIEVPVWAEAISWALMPAAGLAAVLPGPRGIIAGSAIGIVAFGLLARGGTKAAVAGDSEEKSADELAREGYIPFGVGLAIAAFILHAFVGAARIATFLPLPD